MGHSTGCQDIFSYLLTSPSDPDHAIIEGAILQAPVSDRESMIIQPTFSQESYDTSVTYAKEFLSRGQDQEIIPRSILSWFTTVPCTPQRFLSLASPDKNGAEDFFSSDLEDEKLRGTFGRLLSVRVPVCILYSGEDEHVPKFVDKEGLLRRWMRIAMEDGAEQAGIIDEAHSAVISGANHTLDGCTEGVLQDVIRRVVGFVKMCETIKDLNDGLQCSLS
ncbi:MAG: hypothetical protein M1823_003775 [Watsoniomyces obsoletus]|nr:MAG: hypothetical protein M1823_003775 [Watsoniomyces obsoletus]